MSSTAFTTLLAFTAGLGGAVQIAVQGRLGERVGTFEAMATASLVGALLALLVLLVVRRSLVGVGDAFGAPKWMLVGGAMSAYWMNVLWAMGNQLFWEKETGNLALYIMAPSSMVAILLGMALGGMFTTTVRAVSILAIGTVLFDIRFQVSSVPMLCLIFALSLVALYGMGMMFASMFLLFGREGWHLVNLAQEPVFLVSGTFFPIEQMPDVLQGVARLMPLTYLGDALRQTMVGGSAFAPLWVCAAVLAAVLALSLFVSARFFRWQ